MKEYFKKFLISDVAGMMNISPGLIRHYEKIGLIQPIKKNLNNYRQYNIGLIEQLSNIVMLRSLELSLEDIGDIQDAYNTNIGKVINILDDHIATIEDRIRFLQKVSARTINLKKDVEKVKSDFDNITLLQSPELAFHSLNHNLNIEELATNYLRLLTTSLKLPKSAFIISKENLQRDNITLNSYNRFGVCTELCRDSDENIISIPGRLCAYTITLCNEFENVSNKYYEMKEWISKNNYKPADDAIELCNLSIEDRRILEIYIPVEPVK